MEFKGTKGEWIADALTDDGIMLRDKNCTRDIATIWRYEDTFLERQESESNAKLISCAPEMLEMLKEILEQREDGRDYVSISDMRTLIEKATTI